MAPVYSSFFYGPKRQLLIGLLFLIIAGCDSGKKIYMSECDADQTFKHVTYAHLLDSLAWYDKKYIEITGTYEEGKGKSALYNDSTLINTDNTKAFWVNFIQDCPLFLKGTHTGLFDYNNGSFTQINNRKVRIRGKLDVHNHGHLKQYKGCIDRVSLIEL
jgi:hypothetical protein